MAGVCEIFDTACHYTYERASSTSAGSNGHAMSRNELIAIWAWMQIWSRGIEVYFLKGRDVSDVTEVTAGAQNNAPA